MMNYRQIRSHIAVATACSWLLLGAGTTAGDPIDDPIPDLIPAGDVHVRLRTVAAGLTSPHTSASAPGDPHNRMFLGDQRGIIWSLALDSREVGVVGDISDRLVELEGFEVRGLLGMAIHPDFMSNGRLYTFTSEPVNGDADFTTLPQGVDAAHQSVLTEWVVPNPRDPAASLDPTTARVLMRIDQPQSNNNGGAMAFGPADLLYVSFGDGGSTDDEGIGHSPQGNGQDPTNILGSIIRIDPLANNSANGQYGIPPDNPFVPEAGPELDEIFAFGFDDPFKHSFDSETGDFYNATVGTVAVEEINRITFRFPMGDNGALAASNFGWPLKEGSFFVDRNGDDPAFLTTDPPANLPPDLIDPIAQFDQDDGLAVIGGFIYRGSEIPMLEGRYVFGTLTQTFGPDGRLLYLDENDDVLELQILGRENVGLFVLGFGQDNDGELYVLGNTTGEPFGESGVVMKILPIPEPPSSRLLVLGGLVLVGYIGQQARHSAIRRNAHRNRHLPFHGTGLPNV